MDVGAALSGGREGFVSPISSLPMRFASVDLEHLYKRSLWHQEVYRGRLLLAESHRLASAIGLAAVLAKTLNRNATRTDVRNGAIKAQRRCTALTILRGVLQVGYDWVTILRKR